MKQATVTINDDALNSTSYVVNLFMLQVHEFDIQIEKVRACSMSLYDEQ